MTDIFIQIATVIISIAIVMIPVMLSYAYRIWCRRNSEEAAMKKILKNRRNRLDVDIDLNNLTLNEILSILPRLLDKDVFRLIGKERIVFDILPRGGEYYDNNIRRTVRDWLDIRDFRFEENYGKFTIVKPN